MAVNLSALLGNYDRPTNRPTTEGQFGLWWRLISNNYTIWSIEVTKFKCMKRSFAFLYTYLPKRVNGSFQGFDSFQNLLHAQSHTISEYVRWFYQTNNNANKIDKKIPTSLKQIMHNFFIQCVWRNKHKQTPTHITHTNTHAWTQTHTQTHNYSIITHNLFYLCKFDEKVLNC